MMALLLAAHIAAAATPAIPPRAFASRGAGPVPAACRAGGVTEAALAGKARLWKLGELPKPHMEIAINRTVGGCPAPVIVRYDAEMDGRPAPSGG